MPNKTTTPVQSSHLPGFWGVGICSVLLFGVGILIMTGYHNLFWQMADALAQNILVGLRQDWLTTIILALTNFGYYGTILIWLVITGLLAVSKQWRILTLSLTLSLGGFGLGSLLKALTHRPRPMGIALVTETTSSFPSTHALTAILLYLTIAYLTYHYSRKFFMSYLVFLLGLIISISIGLSRIYLGVHYFSDVVASFIFGTGWLFLVIFIEKSICKLQKKPTKSA